MKYNQITEVAQINTHCDTKMISRRNFSTIVTQKTANYCSHAIHNKIRPIFDNYNSRLAHLLTTSDVFPPSLSSAFLSNWHDLASFSRYSMLNIQKFENQTSTFLNETVGFSMSVLSSTLTLWLSVSTTHGVECLLSCISQT